MKRFKFILSILAGIYTAGAFAQLIFRLSEINTSPRGITLIAAPLAIFCGSLALTIWLFREGSKPDEE